MNAFDPFAELRRLELPPGHFAIFGSGPLIVRQLVEPTNDIDVICRGPAWNHVSEIGKPEYLEEYDVHIVSLQNGRLTFGREWAIGSPDIDLLIDTADIIEGLPFVRLEHVRAYKTLADRPKDREHLIAMDRAGLTPD